jgi:predicted aspartyl protease
MNGQSLAEFMGTGNDRQRWFSLRAASQCAIAIMLAAILQVPAFPQSSSPKEISFENSRMFGLVLVKVEVNGRSAILIVDTASNHTIISSELTDAPPRNLDNAVATSRGSGFAGAGVFTKATLKVGPITWRDHKVVAMDMRAFSKDLGQKADGLLGMDFFSDFEVVVVDLKNHKLILHP